MAQTSARTDVIDLLVEQHAQIRHLFMQTLMSEGAERKKFFAQLVHLLAVHETAEEEVIHPAARKALPNGDALIDDRLAEERKAKEILSTLEKMDTSDPNFMSMLDRLRMSVLTHARAEERYEFAQLRDRVGEGQLRAMAAAVKAAEATAPTHPRPGVESATKNLLLGPIAAITDRVRDAIRSHKG
ncbi:hemerythrin domain-containing protein [Actinocorallia populi]|uniref:hemerythrin domain-containing protein n=1 Tax=Actinocorallia populi TaxID=2079200 RepID=UPI000D0948EF|nr:hemerythrin domain-containing protein [Actinocorallia populi]